MAVHNAKGWDSQGNYPNAKAVKSEIQYDGDGVTVVKNMPYYRITPGMLEWESQADWYKSEYATDYP